MMKILRALCLLPFILCYTHHQVNAAEKKECIVDSALETDEMVKFKQNDPLIFTFSVSGTYKLVHLDGEISGPFKQPAKSVDVSVPGKTKDTFTLNDLQIAADIAMDKVHIELVDKKLAPECEKKKCKEEK